jgi:hypothetical protein
MFAPDALENTVTYGIISTYQEQWQVAGQLTLDQHIGVRIPGGSQNRTFPYLSELSHPIKYRLKTVSYADIAHIDVRKCALAAI